jgi:hypothetical protein
MKTWHVVVAAVVIGVSEFWGSRIGRLLRRFHLL